MSERDHDIFTKRGITPPSKRGGHVARAQGFRRYEGADWRERLKRLIKIDPRYGDGHPDPDDAYHKARAKLLDRMLGPKSAAAREYAGPVYDDRYLDIRPFAGIREQRSHKTQARLHFDRTGRAPDDVIEALAAIEPAEAARQSWQGWLTSALAVDGWAMPRHAVLPGDPDFGDPLTQIRPDRPVNLGGDPAKYVYTPGRTAKRLGTNPRARLLPTWDDLDALFVFVLEGTLKMCSVVEAGYPAIDAGSVTLWGGGVDQSEPYEDGEIRGDASWFDSELERFAARHLVGRPVAVACDSDWMKDEVLLQARKVTNVLNRAGARAVACAPPELASGEKRGVDDWLGEHARRDRHEAMLDLVVREPAADDAPGLEDGATRATSRRDQAETCRRLLRELGRDATDDGIAPYRRDDLAQRTERDPRTLDRARNALVRAGMLAQLTEAEHRRGDDGWTTEAPLYLLTPELRPPRRRTTLRDWLQNAPY